MVRHRSSAGGLPRCDTPMPLPSDVPVRVTPWTLPDAAPVDLHRHDAFEIGLCHQGSGVFLVEGKTLPFAAGAVLLVAPHEYHRAHADPGTPCRWTFCFCDAAGLLGLPPPEAADPASLWGPEFANIIAPPARPALRALAAAFIAEAEGGRDPHLLRATLTALLIAARRLPGRRPAEAGRPALLARLAPALDLLAHAEGRPVALTRLAARCGVSLAHLRRAFHAAVGCSPRDYQLRLRIQRAAGLLRDGRHDVLTAALACGFASANGFTRRFRALTGVSPGCWRRTEGSTPGCGRGGDSGRRR